MEYNEIVSLMQEMTKMGLTRIKLERENFKLELEKNINIVPAEALTIRQGVENTKRNETVINEAMVSESMASGAKANAASDKDILGTKRILSPMVGTFYSQPGPDKPAFVSVGDTVKKGQSVCIIEAMKLMNEIESEVEGEIIECLVENEEMVEFGQPLFIVK
ncbi:MAG: acetyl-CoA carboxylase biotin carboxyl carrier protein [Clostridiales bacterium]|jgi:acetyl-CoA carboxylase biotin carboxyl carrier protein|nr:acetyl-CoA carboxylase biotin carboxyl carrier protein [Clostridiales bacterium]